MGLGDSSIPGKLGGYPRGRRWASVGTAKGRAFGTEPWRVGAALCGQTRGCGTGTARALGLLWCWAKNRRLGASGTPTRVRGRLGVAWESPGRVAWARALKVICPALATFFSLLACLAKRQVMGVGTSHIARNVPPASPRHPWPAMFLDCF